MFMLKLFYCYLKCFFLLIMVCVFHLTVAVMRNLVCEGWVLDETTTSFICCPDIPFDLKVTVM